MSVLKKVPVIQSVCVLLSEEELNRLISLFNSELTPTKYSVIAGYDNLLPATAPATVNERIAPVLMRIGPDKIVNGIMVYKNTSNCILIGYTNTVADSVYLPFYKINFTTRLAEPVNENLTIEELRRAVEDCLDKQHGVDPISLADKIEGGTGVVVDLNETQTKVEVHLDMTGGIINGLLVSGSGGQSVSWKTLEEALKAVPGEDEGKFMTLLSTGIAWNNIPTPDTIKLTSLTLTESSGVYTSSQEITGVNDIHVVAECEMSGTHACFGVDLHKYDASVSYGVARVNWGGTMYDVLCRIDEENHVVLDLANLTGLTSVVAKYYKYD